MGASHLAIWGDERGVDLGRQPADFRLSEVWLGFHSGSRCDFPLLVAVKLARLRAQLCQLWDLPAHKKSDTREGL